MIIFWRQHIPRKSGTFCFLCGAIIGRDRVSFDCLQCRARLRFAFPPCGLRAQRGTPNGTCAAGVFSAFRCLCAFSARIRSFPPTRAKPRPKIAPRPQRVHSQGCAASLRHGSDHAQDAATKRSAATNDAGVGRSFTVAVRRALRGARRVVTLSLGTLLRHCTVPLPPAHRENTRFAAFWRILSPQKPCPRQGCQLPPSKARYC